MNIGIRLHDTAPGTLTERLDAARAQGFTCAHLALSKTVAGFTMPQAPALLTDELAARLKSDFAARGIQCAVLGCYLQLTNPDEEERKKIQEIYRAHLRFGPRMGALMVGTETPAKGLTFSDGPAPVSEEAFELFLQGLEPVARWAEEENALLAVEPVCTHVVSTPERAQRMLEAIHSDHLRIILDPVNLLSNGNADQCEAIFDDALRRLGDRVVMMHLKDFTPVNPEKPLTAQVDPCACGLGSVRYEKLLAFAKEKNLPMTLENTKPDNAEQARRYLEAIAEGL